MGLKSHKLLIYLSAIWLGVIMVLGLWWLFLLLEISGELDRNLIRMVVWEGMAFLLLLFFISATLCYFYLQNLKKGRSLASFFAALTHELKTPLASIRLQAEVIGEGLAEEGDSQQTLHLHTLATRLIEDAGRLEHELDKLLQLSRIERGGRSYLTKICLAEFLHRFQRKLRAKVSLDIAHNIEGDIWADEFALNLILRNLVDNSLKHAGSRHITMALAKEDAQTIQLCYDDQGSAYQGKLQHLGKLFYKGPGSQGQGIGLYLIKNLMDKMGGKLDIVSSPHLVFYLTWRKYGPDANCKEGLQA